MGGTLLSEFEGDETYEDMLCTNMDFLRDGNGCKWRGSDKDNYTRCTEALEFGQQCGMEFRFHALVYGAESANPDWLQPDNPEYGNWTLGEKRQLIVDRITEVCTTLKTEELHSPKP